MEEIALAPLKVQVAHWLQRSCGHYAAGQLFTATSQFSGVELKLVHHLQE